MYTLTITYLVWFGQDACGLAGRLMGWTKPSILSSLFCFIELGFLWGFTLMLVEAGWLVLAIATYEGLVLTKPSVTAMDGLRDRRGIGAGS